MRLRRGTRSVAALASGSLLIAALVIEPASAQAVSPITHIVIIDQENRTFDHVLGKLCVEQAQGTLLRAGLNMGCDGTDMGVLADGTPYPLGLESDTGPGSNHSPGGQATAIDKGKMDGFSKIYGCTAGSSPPYACLTQFDPSTGNCGTSGTETCIGNIAQLAEDFAISDRTFEFRDTASWAGHMILGSATIQRFVGGNPHATSGSTSHLHGWGCDSAKVSTWRYKGVISDVPSCIPDQSGQMGDAWTGYTGTTASYVPTIFDRLDAAGLTWRDYGGSGQTNGQATGYNWTVCPTFFECLGSAQYSNLVPAAQFSDDAQNGTIPNVSIVTPTLANSSHPPQSMSISDNWIASVVGAIESNQSMWQSTAIFITFDDCGCFYDHVNPFQYSTSWGIREPMIIVSPYAKAGFTDSEPATFVSMLAFIEHTFDLAPLNPCATVDSWRLNCTDDVKGPNNTVTYDFAGSFDYSQTPLAPVALMQTTLSGEEQRWLAKHPDAGDEAT